MSLSELPSYLGARSPGQIISAMVADAIYPFNPGLVTMWVEQDFDFLKTNIHVTSSTFVDDEAVIDGRMLYAIATEADMAVLIGEQAGAYFANLMNESVPDTIVLGEN